MFIIKLIFHSVLWIITQSLKLCWSILIFIFIDDDSEYSSTDYIHYDHRTGNLDPVERSDSLYDNQW